MQRQDNPTGSDKTDDATIPRSRQRFLVVSVGFSALITVAAAAKVGLIPGSLDGTPYSNMAILQDAAATLLTATLGYLFVYLNTYAVSKEWLSPRDSRKLIHTLSAPLFMLFWPLFTSMAGARVFAAIVPALNALRLYLAASSSASEMSLARAVSRSGNAKEALGGPFIYVVILAVSILLFWRDSAVGIVALSALAAGDGVADLVGRRFGQTNKWPNTDKSVAGSLAFWVASTACAAGLLLWMQLWGCLTLSFSAMELVWRLAGICLVSAILELAPTTLLDDNYSVPISAGVLTALFLQ